MKKILFTLSILSVMMLVNMEQAKAQFVHAWTTTIDSNKRPSGSTVPSVATMAEPKATQTWTIDIPGSLDNATPATAFAAIGAAVKDTILLNRLLGTWHVDTTDITVRTVIQGITRGYKEFSCGDLKNQYQVGTDVFHVIGYSDWKGN